jgi:AcrR family transcriptional regulator
VAADDEELDEELWAPFLALRREDRHAARLRQHVQEDIKRDGRAHLPRRAAALSRDQIVAAAIRIADTEGPEAVSMRRIARELNAGTMSLYWHIASKEELLDRMIDTVQGEQLTVEPSGDWRADMRAMACNSRAALHRHRWMMDFMGGRPPVGRKSLQNLERALTSLDGLGLDPAGAVTIAMTIMTYVLGAVLREVQEMNGERYLAQQFEGVTEEEKAVTLAGFSERIQASGRYPHMAALLEHGVDPDAAETRDERFRYGLDCLLDGIAARIPPPAPPSPPAPQPPAP